MMRFWLVTLSLMLVVPVVGFTLRQYPESDRLAAYANATPDDSIARLQRSIDKGDVNLEFDDTHGYLKSLLEVLGIPASSQSLVYSKSSFQWDRIGPWSPRAIYFNDDVYVGWVRGGDILEIASVDPKLGAVFYTLEQTAASQPRFERQVGNCIQCHDSTLNTGGVPGFVVQSIYSDRQGYAIPSSHNVVSSDRTPLRDRFGGWYVTGTTGDQVHMGNFVAPKAAREIDNPKLFIETVNLKSTQNITDLSDRFDTDPYLSKGSDIAALMLLVHQTYLHNLMTQAMLSTTADNSQNDKAEALVRGLLFVREAGLTSPVRGSAEFARDFARLGPRDHQGRSLRDLDLNQRLLKYPLSYLIYSEAFDSLPGGVKSYVYRRLHQILSGQDQSPEFAHLTSFVREAILQILRETKPDFAETG